MDFGGIHSGSDAAIQGAVTRPTDDRQASAGAVVQLTP